MVLGTLTTDSGSPHAACRLREGKPVLGGVVAPDDEAVAYAHRLDLLQRRLDLSRAELRPGRP